MFLLVWYNKVEINSYFDLNLDANFLFVNVSHGH